MHQTNRRPIIIQVLARFRPSTDGVTDYALQSAQIAREKFGVDTRFLVCSPESLNDGQFDGFMVAGLLRQTAVALGDALGHLNSGLFEQQSGSSQEKTSSVVLHYSGYSYSPDGAPVWLLAALRNFFLGARHDIRLVTIFHELYATSPPWRRAFWYSKSVLAFFSAFWSAFSSS